MRTGKLVLSRSRTGTHSWKSWGILEVSLIQQLDEETREEQASTTSLRQPTGGRVSFWREKSPNWNQLVPNQWLWHRSRAGCSQLCEAVLKFVQEEQELDTVRCCVHTSSPHRVGGCAEVYNQLSSFSRSEFLFLGSLDPSVTARQKSDPSVKGLRWRKAKTYKISFYF